MGETATVEYAEVHGSVDSLATTALAQHLAIDESEVEVQRRVPMEWSDTSLGCPQKGQSYAQVITPGFRVFLWAGDTSYAVHTGDGRAVVCKPTARTAASELTRRQGLVQQIAKAREDLAKRLGMIVTDIELAPVRRELWPGGQLPCETAIADEAGSQAVLEGAVIELIAGEMRYIYQTDFKRLVLCEKTGSAADGSTD